MCEEDQWDKYQNARAAAAERSLHCNEVDCGCYALKEQVEEILENITHFGLYLLNRAKFERIVDDGMGKTKEEK